MRLFKSSTSVIVSFSFILSQLCSAESPWPYNLPPHMKYYPEDEPSVRRNLEIHDKLATSPPNAVKKMGDDAGEMFFLEYWGFEEEEQSDKQRRISGNATMFGPAIRIHGDLSIAPRSYYKRDFTCPTGTNSCTNINRPNSCCPNGLTCNIVSDSGLGDVGCCRDSDSCGGQSSSCPQDYISCPSENGGGCCIPGYECQGVGCVLTSTTVVVVSPTPTSTSTSTSSSSSAPLPATSSSHPSPIMISSTSIRPTTSTCSTGFQSCPSSLGGGCCPTDRQCGSVTCPPSSTTLPSSTSPSTTPSITPSEAPPVRPTSNSPSQTPSPASTTPSACPQNFYACSAYYPGAGCCQVGRNCSSTSCPGRATTSILVSNGVTIAAEPTTGVCASQWNSCPASVGGGCCPSGYACGTQSCSRVSAVASASQSMVGKEEQQSGGSKAEAGWWAIGVTVGIMILVSRE